jgi:hypothetical protein
MALASAVVTMQAQKAGGAIHSAIIYPFYLRLENAIVSYSRYIGKAFWPTQLSPLYPHPLDLLRFWQVIASVIFLLLATALVVRNRRLRPLESGFWGTGSDDWVGASGRAGHGGSLPTCLLSDCSSLCAGECPSGRRVEKFPPRGLRFRR